MSLHKTLATARRVLSQLRHDPRTLALIFLVPCLLIVILKYVFNGETTLFNNLAPKSFGIFPLIVMFIVTSISMLRERTSGTLERLMTLPMSKFDLIFGYALAFAGVAFLQACLVTLVVLGFLGVIVLGGTVAVLISAVLSAFLGTALGLFVSAFARTEFQAVQFMPAFILPQLLICGLFVARDHMARFLQWVADVMPLTYTVDAMKQVTITAGWHEPFTKDLVIVIAVGLVALALGAITIRRQE